MRGRELPCFKKKSPPKELAAEQVNSTFKYFQGELGKEIVQSRVCLIPHLLFQVFFKLYSI